LLRQSALLTRKAETPDARAAAQAARSDPPARFQKANSCSHSADARRYGFLVFSDECYCEFTWEGPPRTILEHGLDGVVAVHSLSKRSNLAGVRAGFYAGDSDLVDYLREVRKHAGFMVPGPVQAAAVVAYADDEHVDAQRERYRNRLERLRQNWRER
jgi:aspartate/methionine/tyrosine aminotransferase